jgi:ABC-2 type transport system ATP-binding protein
VNDVIGVGALWQAGYIVVTWDPRGEWSSGGTLEIDHPIDATIAWHSLTTALHKDEALKSSWGTLLVAALIGTGARVNPRIYPSLF